MRVQFIKVELEIICKPKIIHISVDLQFFKDCFRGQYPKYRIGDRYEMVLTYCDVFSWFRASTVSWKWETGYSISVAIPVSTEPRD